ncbi:MAG TPA: GNAT family N-acetyltransferase [Candidatus Limnocylindrales bacterium]|nr:GNAT family N-acetyltransferase [Candidatus Limnocylindrales bacterium]
MTAVVRAASADDLAALEPILPAFLDPPYKRGRFERALARGEVALAEDRGRAVGFVWTNEFFGHSFVNVLAVDEKQRRRGYAGVLLKYAEQHRLTDRVFTSTNASNAPMHAVLAHYGWRRCGEVDDIDPGDPEIVYVKYPG